MNPLPGPQPSGRRSSVELRQFCAYGGEITELEDDGIPRGDGLPVQTVDNNGHATLYRYDTSARLIASTNPAGTSQLRYDGAGNRTQAISPNGWTVTYGYDEANRVKSEANASGTTYVKYSYDNRGRTTATVDPLWLRLSYFYDELDRLIEVRENLLTEVQHAVNTTSDTVLRQEFLALGFAGLYRDTSSPYIGTTRLKVVTSAAGDGVRVKVPTRIMTGQGLTATLVATGSGTLSVKVRDATSQQESSTTSLTLNSSWQVMAPLSFTLAAGAGLQHSDEVYLEIRAGGAATFYLDAVEVSQSTRTVYDQFPQGVVGVTATYQTTQIDALGRSWSTAHDLLGRAVSSTDPLGNQQVTQYLDAERRQVRIDALGQPTTYQFDSRSRLSAIQYFDGTSVQYSYDANGNRLTMHDILGNTSYSYDELGRPIRVVDPFGRAVSYSYDGAALSRVESLAGVTTYQYNQSGQVSAMKVKSQYGEEHTTTFVYDAAGNLKQQTSGSHVTTWAYDQAERLTQVLSKYGTSNRYKGDYTYDRAGSRNRYTRYTSSDGVTTTFDYLYDPLYRLVKATQSNGDFRTYRYDGVGNRLLKTEGKNSTTSKQETSVFDAANRLASVVKVVSGNAQTTTYEYDGNGNQTRVIEPSGLTTFTYNAASRLTQVSLADGKTVMNRYDGDNRKLFTMDGQNEIYFLYSGQEVLADLDGAGAVVAAYARGPAGNVISTDQRTGRFYYHVDGLGSIMGLTTATGQWDSVYKYDEFGLMSAQKGTAWNTFQFTGATYSELPGLYHLGARHYNPGIGRFITQDTWKGDPWVPWTQNLYVYVGNNPVNYVDPTGHVPVLVAAWALYEIGSSAYDVYDAIKTVFSKDASTRDKTISVLGAAAGLVGFGGGYGKAGKTVAKAADTALDAAKKIERHHMLPRQFESFFKGAGLDIEDYTVPLPRDFHKTIHGKGGGEAWANSWNKQWEKFWRRTPDATAEEVLDQLNRMKKEFGIPE